MLSIKGDKQLVKCPFSERKTGSQQGISGVEAVQDRKAGQTSASKVNSMCLSKPKYTE